MSRIFLTVAIIIFAGICWSQNCDETSTRFCIEPFAGLEMVVQGCAEVDNTFFEINVPPGQDLSFTLVTDDPDWLQLFFSSENPFVMPFGLCPPPMNAPIVAGPFNYDGSTVYTIDSATIDQFVNLGTVFLLSVGCGNATGQAVTGLDFTRDPPASGTDLELMITSGPMGSGTLNQTLQYDVTLTNQGGQTAEDVLLTVPVIPGSRFASGSLNGTPCSVTNGSMNCDGGQLGSAQSINGSFTFEVSIPGVALFQPSVSFAACDDNLSNNSETYKFALFPGVSDNCRCYVGRLEDPESEDRGIVFKTSIEDIYRYNRTIEPNSFVFSISDKDFEPQPFEDGSYYNGDELDPYGLKDLDPGIPLTAEEWHQIWLCAERAFGAHVTQTRGDGLLEWKGKTQLMIDPWADTYMESFMLPEITEETFEQGMNILNTSSSQVSNDWTVRALDGSVHDTGTVVTEPGHMVYIDLNPLVTGGPYNVFVDLGPGVFVFANLEGPEPTTKTNAKAARPDRMGFVPQGNSDLYAYGPNGEFMPSITLRVNAEDFCEELPANIPTQQSAPGGDPFVPTKVSFAYPSDVGIADLLPPNETGFAGFGSWSIGGSRRFFEFIDPSSSGIFPLPLDIDGTVPDATLSLYTQTNQRVVMGMRGWDGEIVQAIQFEAIPGVNNLCLDTIFDSFGSYIDYDVPDSNRGTTTFYATLFVEDAMSGYVDIIQPAPISGNSLITPFFDVMGTWQSSPLNCLGRIPNVSDLVAFYGAPVPCIE